MKSRFVGQWYEKVPGLLHEIELLAWKHRDKMPLIDVTTSHDDIDGGKIRVQMVPRQLWDGPRFLEFYTDHTRQSLRQIFADSSFCTSKHFICLFRIEHHGDVNFTAIAKYPFRNLTVRGTAIVEALTNATRAEDLADAFAWVESSYLAHAAQKILRYLRDRCTTLVQDNTISQGCVPVPTRAINNEVAYAIMRGLHLEFEIRLTGLCSAAHLNGREGVIRDHDTGSRERFKARLSDGTHVSVKAANFVHVRRGDYRRISP
jgi:hypothetical protein